MNPVVQTSRLYVFREAKRSLSPKRATYWITVAARFSYDIARITSSAIETTQKNFVTSASSALAAGTHAAR